jgi:hypothetical protein
MVSLQKKFMEEKIHNVNLQPVESVRRWDTKRVKSYMERIQKHISFLETRPPYDNIDHAGLTPEQSTNQEGIVLQKFKNYKEELKKILTNREHIQ